MKVEYKVKRYNPESDVARESFDTYVVELDQAATVLDGLIKIREEVDNTLTLRCSCRSAICGSCAMRINGQAMLACNTKVSDFEEYSLSPEVESFLKEISEERKEEKE